MTFVLLIIVIKIKMEPIGEVLFYTLLMIKNGANMVNSWKKTHFQKLTL